MKRVIEFLQNRSVTFFIVFGGLLVLFIGFIDIITQDLFVFEFYLIPVVIVTWFAGRKSGFFMAIFAAAVEIALDVIETAHHLNPLTHYWNFVMNLAFFILVVYVVTAMKEAFDVKSKFTSTVSHELRTPLAVITESINLMVDGLCGSLTEKQSQMLNIARMNARRLGLLINDILDFQKFESGKMKIVPEKNDINKVIHDAYKGIELLGKEKELEFVFNLAGDMPKIRLDSDRIAQVVTNLLSNAIKFTDKGRITVSTSKMGESVRVEVNDTGMGISPGEMPRLFKSFQQLGDAGKRMKKGTGLGLVISKEIVLRHGGKIWAESVPGKGASFIFTLPIQ